ncbi:MAG TPA: sigma-70 family RNA polymerase sigma factor [Thermodesulfobacteriota bacterium]|nr:sigma-70 family RNA polymerase sigma factor [Thermodesulfobacteriota bacterium]
MQMESDIELMLRAKSGDESAFTDLMRRHYKGLVNYIYRFTNDREASEDVAQEVFLRVYRSVKSYKPEARFSTWLYKIATNLCLTRIKSKARERNVSLDEIEEITGDLGDSDSESADQVTFRKEIRNAIFEALESLSERERVAIILCKYEGLPYEEVAEVIGCTVGAVKTYVYRGRMKLIEMLKPYLKEGGRP